MTVEDPCPACKNPDCQSEGPEPWECLDAALRKKDRCMMNSPISDEDALEAIRWCWVNNATIDFLCVGGVRVSVWTIHTSSLRFQNPVPSKVEGQGANLALAIADWKKNAGEDHTLAILEKLSGGRKKRKGR